MEEKARLVERLRQTDEELKHELLGLGEAKAAAARAEVACEASRRALEEATVSLHAAQGELEQAKLASASLHDTTVRQGEAIGLKDLEIGRMRETAVAAEASIKAWMERALIAERPPIMPPASPMPFIEVSTQKPVRRRRARTGPDQLRPGDPGNPEGSASVALPYTADEHQDPSSARTPR